LGTPAPRRLPWPPAAMMTDTLMTRSASITAPSPCRRPRH
jgi:hypothetical protein